MSEERLKEIKINKSNKSIVIVRDNIAYSQWGIADEVLNIIEELYNEVIRLREIIDDIKEYVNYLVIFNQTINGKFSETQWGEDILDLLKENNND